ncbi:MAG: PhnD/SsuA/transferrin family substrate-binding protein [Ahniella sp.]|nr:PhnD/SsuA/transferrin family substrate-binding protein [Ahniella sp.]
MKQTLTRMCAALSLALAAGSIAAAEFKIAIEPHYSPQRSAEVYAPLAYYLNRALKPLNHTVTFVYPRNFHFFWRDVRQNAPVDFMFAEAHLTDYRAKRFQFEPLLKTVENTSYAVLSMDEVAAKGSRGLIGARVVTMPSPSMGFALLAEIFPDPVRQPNVMSTAASWRDGVEIVFAGEAEAAIVPSIVKDEYPNLVVITTTREFPGPALSAAPGVDPGMKQALTEALLKVHEDTDGYAALNELRISQFVPVTAGEYDGKDELLKSFFGYKSVDGSEE